MKRTILFLSADPSNASRLRLGQEFREIQERLSLAKLRQEFALVERMSARPSDITQAIFDTEPEILHFAGHGTSAGELCFENEAGELQTIKPDALAALFELVSDQVDCVILNACFSENQARAIAEHIGFVVGMNKEIGDKAAIAFAEGFYKALGAGRSIEEAYKFGVVELKLWGIPEHLTPVLVKKRDLDLPHFSQLLHPREINSHTTRIRIKSYPDYASFELREGKSEQVVFMNPNHYNSLQTLFDDLFVGYLSSLVSPYSYGEEWIIKQQPNNYHVIAPWEWIAQPNKSIYEVCPHWVKNVSPSEQGILPDTFWTVSLAPNIAREGGYYGIATDNEAIARYMMRTPKAVYLLQRHRFFIPRSLEEMVEKKYRYMLVFQDWLNHKLQGRILEDSGKHIDLQAL